jgi:HEAT repeat protein
MSNLDDLFCGDDERAAAAAPLMAAHDLPALAAALAGTDPDARWWAVAGLAYIPGAPATQLLLRAAEDVDPNLRAAALHALGQHGGPEAIPALLRALGDASDYLARLATDALVHATPQAVPELISTLKTHPHPRVRANAARALAFIGDTSAIPALFGALSDDSILVQHWADEGLERMGVGQIYFKP